MPAPGLRVAAWPAERPGAVNPFPALLSRALRDAGAHVEELAWGRLVRERFDVVHVHWPEWVLDSGSWRRRARMLGALAIARRRGAVLVWTIHNLGAHDSAPPRGRAWQLFSRSVDGVISLTEVAIPSIHRAFPALANTPTFVVPHGHYRDVYPPAPPRHEARAALGIAENARVLLTFGHLRPYKGIPRLLNAFAKWDDPNAVLIVAGAPADAMLAREVRERAARDARVRLHLEAVPVDDVARYFGSADLVVLPYREILNSGAALLALSFNRSVLAPAIGAFPELAERVGTNRAGNAWVRTFSGPLDADTLRVAMTDDPPEPDECPDLEPFAWDRIAAATIDAYETTRRARAG